VQFDDLSKCGDALENGQVDAVTADTGILAGLVYGSKNAFQVVGTPYAANDYGIGIKKGDVVFCRFIDDVIAQSHADGSFEKAWRTTLGQVQPRVPSAAPAIPCA
jgi:glutamate transport system substrate-binding protein